MKTLKHLMKRKIILISCLSLIACQNMPKELQTTQMNAWMKFERDPVDGRLYVNETESFCFKRGYLYSVDYIGPKGATSRGPLSDCDQVIGYGPKEYGEVTKFQEQIRQLIKDEMDD